MSADAHLFLPSWINKHVILFLLLNRPESHFIVCKSIFSSARMEPNLEPEQKEITKLC